MSIRSLPKPFSTLTQWYILIFCDEFTPKNQSPKGRTESILHLIGALFRRTANQELIHVSRLNFSSKLYFGSIKMYKLVTVGNTSNTCYQCYYCYYMWSNRRHFLQRVQPINRLKAERYEFYFAK